MLQEKNKEQAQEKPQMQKIARSDKKYIIS